MSLGQWIVILLVALVVVKPERLPELAYLLGRLVAYVRGGYALILKKYQELL